MNNLHEPITEERKKFLEEECGKYFGIVSLKVYVLQVLPHTSHMLHHLTLIQTMLPVSYQKYCVSTVSLNIDHMFSAFIFGASMAGRWYAPKINVTRFPFTVSAVCKYINFSNHIHKFFLHTVVPVFYLLAINHKEKRFAYSHEARRTFDQNLEFYPVTRRAFNRAKAIRQQELGEGN